MSLHRRDALMPRQNLTGRALGAVARQECIADRRVGLDFETIGRQAYIKPCNLPSPCLSQFVLCI